MDRTPEPFLVPVASSLGPLAPWSKGAGGCVEITFSSVESVIDGGCVMHVHMLVLARRCSSSDHFFSVAGSGEALWYASRISNIVHLRKVVEGCLYIYIRMLKDVEWCERILMHVDFDTWLITSKVRICPALRHHLAVRQLAYATGWSGSWDALKFRGKTNRTSVSCPMSRKKTRIFNESHAMLTNIDQM